MKRKALKAIAFAVAVALLAWPSVGYAEAKTGTIKVGVGSLSGVLTSSSGQLLEGVQVRLMQGEKTIAETTTAKDGKYAFNGIEAGNYTIKVASERGLDIEASKGSKVNQLSLVLPTRDNYASAELGTLTQAQWVWIAIGTAAIVAVVVPVLYNTTNVFGGGTSDSP